MSALLRRCVLLAIGGPLRSSSRVQVGVSPRLASGGRGSDGDGAGGEEVIPVPPYTPRAGENTETKRARLLMQSRKRGMLENCLLLSSFASEHLHRFSPEQLTTYDLIINKPDNDWQIYYWITGKEDPPDEFLSDVFTMLREHTSNPNREMRTQQPELSFQSE